MPLGVLIYAGVGVAGLLLGGNYLDYFALAARPGARPASAASSGSRSACSITVAGIMLTIFYTFAERRALMDDRADALPATSTTSSPSS